MSAIAFSRPALSVSHRLLVATLAAYLTADFIAALSGSVLGGVDPGVLVVPFCAAFAIAFPFWGRAADGQPAGRVLAVSLAGVAAGGLLLAAADSRLMLVVARLVEGAAAAGVPPTAQALLAARAGDGGAGRAVSGMMIAVAVATLGGPALASVLEPELGWRATTVLLGVLPAALAAGVCASLGTGARPVRGRLWVTPALVAGWACSTLVLAAYWTLLTRWAGLAGGAGIAHGASALLPVAGALGIPLVVVAGRSADRHGPRRAMTLTMGVGALGLGLAAAAQSGAVFLLGAGVALALYWSYLPVVSAQVQRSAPADARAGAAGVLYSSMWLGAALGGLVAAAAPSWRVVVAGAAVSWALAGLIAARGFLRGAAA